MPISSTSIQTIINAGGSVIVRSSQYSSTVLQTMATATRRSNSKLTIKVDNNLSSISMQTIATAGQGRVTFDLT